MTITDETTTQALTDATTTSDAPSGEVLREWKNPTAREVVFTLYSSRRRRVTNPETQYTFEVDENVPHEIRIAPGATAKLLSRWDHAVQTYTCQDAACTNARCKSPATHRGVVVMGGLAPQLRRADVHATIHPALVSAPLAPSRTSATEDDLIAAARRRKGAK